MLKAFAKMRKPLCGGSQSGAGMVEYIIAFGILGISAYGTLSTFQQMWDGSSQAKSSDLILEKDQVVRFEVTKVLDRFQKRLTELSPNKQCVNPYGDFVDVVQNGFKLPVVYHFGNLKDLHREKEFPKSITRKMQDFERFLKRDSTRKKTEKFIGVRDAIKRCKANQTVRKSGGNMKNRNSFYFCGYSEGSFVEVKAAFWDFNIDSPIKCGDMNGRTGRGVQAIYSVYHFQELPSKKDHNKGNFKIKSHDGRVYVAKHVW